MAEQIRGFPSKGQRPGGLLRNWLPPAAPGPHESNSLAHAIVAAVRDPFVVLDRNFGVVAASDSFAMLFKLDKKEILGRSLFQLKGVALDDGVLRPLLSSVISGGAILEGHALEIDAPESGRRHLLLSARLVSDSESPRGLMLVGLEDVTDRREAETVKDSLMRQQETLLQELQHRVANSLQIIASILLLKARTVQSEETRLHLRDVHRRVISIATVQRQLWTSGQAGKIDLAGYLSTLCEGLASSMIPDESETTVTSSCRSGSVAADDAVSLGLIVTELVLNALKHGLPDGRDGRIEVAFTGDANVWRLSVSDNGVGRAPGEQAHVGLGTTIVEALATQLKARVEIVARDPGTVTSIVHAGGGFAGSAIVH